MKKTHSKSEKFIDAKITSTGKKAARNAEIKEILLSPSRSCVI
jgi:hypothetical protein